METVVILGGGPCGLSAAWELSGTGKNVVIIEAQSSLGGLCKTVRYKGFNFDLGGHRLISKNEELLKKISGLMGDELLVSERISAIRLNGREFQYPLSTGDILKQTDIRFLSGCLIDYAYQSIYKKIKHYPDTSFEDWVINRFGKKLYNTFFKDYTRKLWGIPPDKLSSDWAAERISLLNLWDVVLRLCGIGENTPRTYTRNFFYPKRGIGQIFEYIAEEIKENEGNIILNARFKMLLFEGKRLKGVVCDINGKDEVIDCDWIISTIPITDLLCNLNNGGEWQDVSEVVKSLRYRSLRFLNILIDKSEVGKNTWTYIPEGKYIMTRIQEPRKRSSHNAPDGKTSLILEIPCFYNDEIWNMPDDLLFKRCISDLLKLGIDIKDKMIDYFYTREKHAYPIYHLDYKHHLKKLTTFLGTKENILTSGRNGLFRYIFMDRAMEMGFEASKIVQNSR
ncbi:MAG: FAD-dependent oxidoreductase [Thermodesulfobacteriota bacterium]